MAVFGEREYMSCCESFRFAKEMVDAGPFSSYTGAVEAARDIWFNKVNVDGWLGAFSAHPMIGEKASDARISAHWSKGEQSTASATATESTFQELSKWNHDYMRKFGFIFLICASGKSTPEILSEIKKRYQNRPIVELEIAAQEQMKITELRLAKLFENAASRTMTESSGGIVKRAEEDRMNVIGAHFAASGDASTGKPSQSPTRTRPPITTHVLDVAHGCPAAGIEVRLETWNGDEPPSLFTKAHEDLWKLQGSSVTDKDGRSGQLIDMVDSLRPGIYRISFNTGKYNPNGLFPYVSIVFEVKESQKWEHFHVPLLLSPFSFSTYRGS